MTATWESRYPQERELVTEQPFECHDFRDYGTHELKRGETACNMAVSTQDGDLDIFSRPLRPGS